METEPDIHDRLIRVIQSSFRESDTKDQAHLIVNFKSVATENALPEKKPPKDFISTEGILKHNWPTKHYENVPSVLVFTVAFSVDWTLSEWVRKEAWIQDRFSRLKPLTTARDIKIVVVVIKVGAGATDKDTMDDRLNSLKKHLQLDSRTFHLLTSHDISNNSAATKKVTKYIKDYSTQYYINKVKALKTLEKVVMEKYKGLDESILLARINFKIAFFFEFQSQQLQSLRYYRQCYQHLTNCADWATDDLLEQVKTVAEMVHFKICNVLFLTNAIGDTFVQFKAHMKRFVNINTVHPWRHYAWVADQYVVFAELLHQFAISDALPDADRGYYYQNAARYNQKRQASFEKVKARRAESEANRKASSSSSQQNRKGPFGGGSDASDAMRTSFKGMIVIAPRFVGSAIQFEEPLMDNLQVESSRNTFADYLQEQELGVVHGALIMQQLSTALERTNYAFVRRRGLFQYLIAEQLMKDNHYDRALESLKVAAELLCEEGWNLPAISILSLLTKCAIHLGRPVDFLNAALALYANAAQDVLTRHEVEALHLNILSLIEATLLNPSQACTGKPALPESSLEFQKMTVRNRDSFLTTAFTPLINRRDYGQAILESDQSGIVPVEYCLSNHYVAHLSADKQMFDIQVAFGQKSVELGQSVLVTLTLRSKYIDTMVFDEMKIHFTDNVVVKHIVGTDNMSTAQLQQLPSRPTPTQQITIAGAGKKVRTVLPLNEKETDSDEQQVSNADVIFTSLAFPAQKEVQFSFYLYISEPCLSKFVAPDAILCLEKVELSLLSKSRLEKLHNAAPPATAPASTPTSAGANNIGDSVGEEGESGASVVFAINAFPQAMQRALDEVTLAAGKPHSLKDIVQFCACDEFGAVAVRKPNALISIVEPVQNVNLLQGVVQRVNVYLKLGQSDVLDGFVYLSSDHTPQCAEDALFWYPDKARLMEVSETTNGEHPSSDILDTVPLHPIALSGTNQPAQPIHIPAPNYSTSSGSNTSNAETVICVPLFLKCDTAKSVSVSLRVEFVPRGILRSSLTKDFSISVSFLSPFDVKYTLGRDGSAHDLDVSAISAGQTALLSASLVCSNSLQNAVGVLDMRLDTARHGNFEIVCGNAAPATSAVLLGGDVNFSYNLPLPLRSQEHFTRSVFLRQKPASAPVQKPLSAYEAIAHRDAAAEKAAALRSTTIDTVLGVGSVEVSWRILQSHLLLSPATQLNTVALVDSPVKQAFFSGTMTTAASTSSKHAAAGTAVDWLLSLGREKEKDVAGGSPGGGGGRLSIDAQAVVAATDPAADLKFLDRSVFTTPLCRQTFPVPDIKVCIISKLCPSISPSGLFPSISQRKLLFQHFLNIIFFSFLCVGLQ